MYKKPIFDKVTSFHATKLFDKSQPDAKLRITTAKYMRLEYNIKGIRQIQLETKQYLSHAQFPKYFRFCNFQGEKKRLYRK